MALLPEIFAAPPGATVYTVAAAADALAGA
jgi:hypothetical protein